MNVQVKPQCHQCGHMQTHRLQCSATKGDMGNIQPPQFFAMALQGQEAIAGLMRVEVSQLQELRRQQPVWLTCGVGMDGTPMLPPTLLGVLVRGEGSCNICLQ